MDFISKNSNEEVKKYKINVIGVLKLKLSVTILKMQKYIWKELKII